MKRILIFIICISACPSPALAQPIGDCVKRFGGNDLDADCYGCQFIRDEHNVWDYEDPVIHTHSDRQQDGSGAVVYHCTQGTTIDRLTATVSTTATETLTFQTTGGGAGRIGLSALLVADASFGGHVTNGENSSVSSTATTSAMRENVPDCEGVGLESNYTKFTKTGSIREYQLVSYYICDCTIQGGYVLSNALVVYYCQPRFINAMSDLVRTTSGIWLVGASYFPPRAPTSLSPSRCDYCEDGGGGGSGDDGPCGCSDDLDPNEDEDGDGIANGIDDRPYGYDGDDPDGDDDGDGIANKDDATPYGYD